MKMVATFEILNNSDPAIRGVLGQWKPLRIEVVFTAKEWWGRLEVQFNEKPYPTKPLAVAMLGLLELGGWVERLSTTYWFVEAEGDVISPEYTLDSHYETLEAEVRYASASLSAHKWDDILAGTGIDLAARNCALCIYARISSYHGCRACPIMSKVGVMECLKTPYPAWINHHSSKHPKNEIGEFAKQHRLQTVEGCSECRTLAKRERDFLVEVVDQEYAKLKKLKEAEGVVCAP